MSKIIIVVSIIVISVVLAACGVAVGLPTLEPTPVIPLPTQPVPTLQPTPASANTPPPTVRITGNVYVRDAADVRSGWLYAGQVVVATCADNYCTLLDGNFVGLHVWRGCTDNNPDGLGCEKR